MKTYIVLLRGINVSGKNKLPMAGLRDLLNQLSFQNVTTYIQSGNIILTSDESKTTICKKIKEGILAEFGHEVPVIVKTVSELKRAIDNYPFSLKNKKIVAFSFLHKKVATSIFEVKNIGDDSYKIDEDIVYLHCPSGFGKTKLTNNTIEIKLNVTATTRNLRTTRRLLELVEK